MRHLRAITALLAATAGWSSAAQAEQVLGLSGTTIVKFDSSSPGTIQSSTPISGLNGDTLTGIDFRPATSQLYSVSTTGVFCRPSCASRRPRREHVRFHRSAAEAFASSSLTTKSFCVQS